ncbi:GNAT family N-acetyltransferase [Streptococcus sp. 19428wA2_WM07]|nr:GNAT family N-acetyltransferase [Streptococcus sp. 19428wA2_WM07]
MLTNSQFSDFLLRFPEDVQLVLKDMIPSYQQGYMDYVYQTDKVDIQARRIKNLIKNFRIMGYTYVMPMPQDLALEIASDWMYPSYLEIDLQDVNREILSADARENRYFVVIWNGAMMGYFRLLQTEATADLFLSLKPKYLGKGNGIRFYQAIEGFLKKQGRVEILQVKATEQRVQRFFVDCGFNEDLSDTRFVKRL